MDEVDKLIQNRVSISDEEVAGLYRKIPGVWVLLEPIAFDRNKRAKELKILKYNKDKEVLRNFLIDSDEWNGDALIYFYTGDDGNCKI